MGGTAEHEPTADVQDTITGRLLALFRLMQANFEESAGALGLTSPEGHALHHLAAPAPMRAMADSLCCDASYVTVLVDRLERRGLVVRSPDPEDRRVKRLVLTENGVTLRAALMAAIHSGSSALQRLDAQERTAFNDLLGKLVAGSGAAGSHSGG